MVGVPCPAFQFPHLDLFRLSGPASMVTRSLASYAQPRSLLSWPPAHCLSLRASAPPAGIRLSPNTSRMTCLYGTATEMKVQKLALQDSAETRRSASAPVLSSGLTDSSSDVGFSCQELVKKPHPLKDHKLSGSAQWSVYHVMPFELPHLDLFRF